MRRETQESKEIFNSTIKILNDDYPKNVKIKYNWKGKLPPHIIVSIEYYLGLSPNTIKIGFMFSGDIELWKQLINENRKIPRMCNWWVKIDDDLTDLQTEMKISHYVNFFWDRALDWSYDTAIGLEDVIYPHKWIKGIDNKK